MTATSWLRAERTSFVAEQILDAAGRLFAEHGVAAVTMADVAGAVGCSRATLYRYVENRDALRVAFVHREARRIGSLVAAELVGVTDPRQRLVDAMATSLRLVRSDDTLAGWFTEGDAGLSARLAQSSTVIEELVAGFLRGDADGAGDPVVRRRAQWVVRVLVSLLADPEPSEDEERLLIAEFVAPVVAGPG